MKTQAAIEWAETVTALAEKLDITPGAISQWGEYPPDARQLQLQKISKGKLKAERGCRERLLAPRVMAKSVV
jgi:hypothetical protein